MKAEELRVGIFVYERGFYLGKNPLVPDGGISDGSIPPAIQLTPELLSKYILQADFLNPVILTEEWLVKFGFKSSSDADYELGPVRYMINDKTFAYKCGIPSHVYASSCEDDPHYDIELPHIKFVHQLQNLYFALTSEELTVK